LGPHSLPGDNKSRHPNGDNAAAGPHLSAGVRRPQRPADGVVPLETDNEDRQYGRVAHGPLDEGDHFTWERGEGRNCY